MGDKRLVEPNEPVALVKISERSRAQARSVIGGQDPCGGDTGIPPVSIFGYRA